MECFIEKVVWIDVFHFLFVKIRTMNVTIITIWVIVSWLGACTFFSFVILSYLPNQVITTTLKYLLHKIGNYLLLCLVVRRSAISIMSLSLL